ncbi:PE domain-containing protein [Pseudonocardia tropica]|uniref:PE domain-containing protein n=1 Tax=Pseudonocardia tropica TaxID=681289 RepID=A0ABV1JMU4_9PSEU
MSDLTSQVSPDTVLDVGRSLAQQAEAIRAALQNALGCAVGPCGEDPISGIATPVFDEKFAAIIDRHMAHRTELEQAVTSLRAVAASYRIDEAAIEKSFRI